MKSDIQTATQPCALPVTFSPIPYNLFTVVLKEQADDGKLRLLLRKLGSAEHDRYSNYFLTNHPRDYNFAETVEILK